MSTATTPQAPVVPAPAPSRFGFFSRILGPAAPVEPEPIAETKPEPQLSQQAPAPVADSGTLLRERLRARVPISASNVSQSAAPAAPTNFAAKQVPVEAAKPFQLFGDVLVQPSANNDILNQILDKSESTNPVPEVSPVPVSLPSQSSAASEPAKTLDDVVVPVMASIALRNRLNARVPISASRTETPSRLNRADSSASTSASSAIRDRMNARVPISAAIANRTPITTAVNNRVPISAGISDRVPITASRTEAPASSNYGSRSLNRSESAVSIALRDRLAARQPISSRTATSTEPSRGTPNLSLDTKVEQSANPASSQESPAPATANGGVFNRFFAARVASEAAPNQTATVLDQSPIAEPVRATRQTPRSLASVASNVVAVNTARSSLRERLAARQPISAARSQQPGAVVRSQSISARNAVSNRFVPSKFQAQSQVDQKPTSPEISASPEELTDEKSPAVGGISPVESVVPESATPSSDTVAPAANSGVFNRLFGAKAAAPALTDVPAEAPPIQQSRFARSQAAPTSFASVATQAVAVNSATSSLRERMAARVPISAAQIVSRTPASSSASRVFANQESPKPEPKPELEPEPVGQTGGIFSSIFGSKLAAEAKPVPANDESPKNSIAVKESAPIAEPTLVIPETKVISRVEKLAPPVVAKVVEVKLIPPEPEIDPVQEKEPDAPGNSGVFGRLFGRQAKPVEVQDEVESVPESKASVVDPTAKDVKPASIPVEMVASKSSARMEPQLPTKPVDIVSVSVSSVKIDHVKEMPKPELKVEIEPIEVINVIQVPEKAMSPIVQRIEINPQKPQSPMKPAETKKKKQEPGKAIEKESVQPKRGESKVKAKPLPQPPKETLIAKKVQEQPKVDSPKPVVLPKQNAPIPSQNVPAAIPVPSKPVVKDADAEALEEVVRVNSEMMAKERAAETKAKAEVKPQEAGVSRWFFSAPKAETKTLSEDELAMQEIARLNAEMMAEAVAEKAASQAEPLKPEPPKATGFFSNILGQPAKPVQPKIMSDEEKAMEEIAKLNAEIMAAQQNPAPVSRPEPSKATGFFSNIMGQSQKPAMSEEDKAREEIAKLNAEMMAEAAAEKSKAAPEPIVADAPKPTGFFSNFMTKKPTMSDEENAREEIAKMNAEIIAEMMAEEVTPTPERQKGEPKISGLSNVSTKKSEMTEEERAREEIARLNAEMMAEMMAEEASLSNSVTPKKFQISKEERVREEIASLNAEMMVESPRPGPTPAKKIDFFSRTLIQPKQPAFKPRITSDEERARDEIARLNAEVLADIQRSKGVTANAISQSQSANLLGADALNAAAAEDRENERILSSQGNGMSAEELEVMQAREELARLNVEIMAEDLSDLESEAPRDVYVEPARNEAPPFIAKPKYDLAYFEELAKERAREEIALMKADTQPSKGEFSTAPTDEIPTAEDLEVLRAREELAILKAEMEAEDFSDLDDSLYESEDEKETPMTSSSSSSFQDGDGTTLRTSVSGSENENEGEGREILKPLWLAEGVPISSRVSLLNKGLEGLMKDLRGVEMRE